MVNFQRVLRADQVLIQKDILRYATLVRRMEFFPLDRWVHVLVTS